MIRFLAGLAVGAAGAGITWAVTDSPGWTALIGLALAVLVWFGQVILDDLL